MGALLRGRGWRPVVVAAYVAVIAVFFYVLASFHVPGKGFSFLLTFGERLEASRLPAMRGLEYYVLSNSYGYDAQYYAQIAMDPLLRDPHLAQAVDSVPYRARRILFSWTAFAFGLGRPAWILEAYALQNAICWLALAALLLHWFPPQSWNDFLRWVGVLASFGMCISLRHALVDGPSLLLVAFGVWAVEKNRTWLSAAVLASGGLGKETALLGAAALVDPEKTERRRWVQTALQLLLVAAPLALWLAYIQRYVAPATDLGARNFDWPLVAWARKWSEVIGELFFARGRTTTVSPAQATGSLLMLVALTVQFLFLVARPQPRRAWWRVSASYAVLMVFLGDAVWEGYPGAASRVLLPMQLAFNVLVPRTRSWVVVLALGNLTLISAPPSLQPPGSPGFEFEGPAELLVATDGEATMRFSGPWYDLESKSRWRARRWSGGDATIVIHNPQPYAVVARVKLGLNSVDRREVRISRAGEELWRGATGPTVTAVELLDLRLAPGANEFSFHSPQPAVNPEDRDPRALAFCVHDVRIEFLARAQGNQ